MTYRFGALIIAAIIGCMGTALSALAQADLSLTFSGGPNGSGCGGTGTCGGIIPIAPGGQALYELIVRNNGPASAAGVSVTVTFPPKTSIANFGPPGAYSCSLLVVSGNPTLTCTQSTLAPNTSFAVAIVINLATDYPWQDGLSSTASVTSSTADPVPTNNSVTDNLAVQAPITIPALGGRSLALLIAMLALAGVAAISRVNA